MNDDATERTAIPMSPFQEACGLVASLGWDWYDALDELEDASDAVLYEFLKILNGPPSDKETERHRLLSRVGTRHALFVLHERAKEIGQLLDDGCPLGGDR